MTLHVMQGGRLDGREVEVPDHCVTVVFPGIDFPASTGRSLLEMESEIRFDPETFRIVAPPDLVPRFYHVKYDRTPEGFVFAGES